jgi:hypothetical protein
LNREFLCAPSFYTHTRDTEPRLVLRREGCLFNLTQHSTSPFFSTVANELSVPQRVVVSASKTTSRPPVGSPLGGTAATAIRAASTLELSLGGIQSRIVGTDLDTIFDLAHEVSFVQNVVSTARVCRNVAGPGGKENRHGESFERIVVAGKKRPERCDWWHCL